MCTDKYHNEANILITVQNLTKREIKTMEQILFNMARCMSKLFQIAGELTMIKRTGE
jgi:hypothetical protein